MALVGGERGEVDRRLGIGRQNDQRLARTEARQLAPRADQRQRAAQAAGVEGSYDPDMIAERFERREP